MSERARLARRLARCRKVLLEGPEPFDVRCEIVAKWIEATELEFAPKAEAAAGPEPEPCGARDAACLLTEDPDNPGVVWVAGTLVTVGHVVSLIVEGWTWSDILRAHPELTEADIRACLCRAVEDDIAAAARAR